MKIPRNFLTADYADGADKKSSGSASVIRAICVIRGQNSDV